MISLRSFSLVISLVLLRQAALQSPANAIAVTDHSQSNFHWLVGGCVLFCVIGKFLPVIAMFRADNVSRMQAWHEMEGHRGWLEWCWLVAQGWLVTQTGFGQALARAEQNGWPAALLIFAWFMPTIVFLSALEFGFTQLECLWSADGDQSSLAHWKRWLARVRLGGLGSVITCLVPVMFLLLATDAIETTLPGLNEFQTALFALVALGVVGLTLAPLWLRIWNGAKPVATDEPIVLRVQYFCRRLNIAAPQLCQVGVGQTWRGVALVGWTPLYRQLWIGPAVIKALTAEQLDMVLLHELAHLKRGHCWWRIIPLLLVGVTAVALMCAWPLADAMLWDEVAVLAAFALGMIWMLGRISRHCELDADSHAVRYAVEHCSWADGQPTRAITGLSEALVQLHDPEQNPTQGNWLHPSLSRRIAIKP